MRRVIAPLLLTLLLAAGGAAAWLFGNAERRAAEGRQALATLQFTSAQPTAADQASANYWLARYDALSQQHDASGALVERDPDVLFVAANAAYRSLDRSATDRQALVRTFDGIIKSYAEVLKKEGAPEDAAYNYEFLVRQRDTVARNTDSARGKAAAAKVVAPATDQPSIHGHQGAPPKTTDASSFRIIIPRQTDERDEELKPGTGDVKKRKG